MTKKYHFSEDSKIFRTVQNMSCSEIEDAYNELGEILSYAKELSGVLEQASVLEPLEVDETLSFRLLRDEEKKLEQTWGAPADLIVENCLIFADRLAEKSLERIGISSDVTKENIKKFFDGAERVETNAFRQYPSLKDAHFEDFDWDKTLSSPNAKEIINGLGLYRKEPFLEAVLCVGENGLYIANDAGTKEHLAEVKKELDYGTYSPRNITYSVKQGRFDLKVRDRYREFLGDTYKFIKMLGKAEFSQVKEGFTDELTKKNIWRFFDRATSNVYAMGIEELGYKNTDKAKYFQYDWDGILARPDAADIINKMNLFTFGTFTILHLQADEDGLHLVEKSTPAQFEWRISKALKDKDYTEEDIVESTKTGAFTKKVLDTYSSVFDISYQYAYREFMEMLVEAEMKYIDKIISSKTITKEAIKKFFDKACSNIFAYEVGDYGETENAKFSDYDWDEILARPDAAKFIDNLNLHYYGDFAAPTLAADENGLHIENWGEDWEPHACSWDHLREDLKLGDYGEDDIVESACTGKFTKAVIKRYEFLEDSTKKKTKSVGKEV